MEEEITIESIMDWFHKAVTEKQPISPDTWLDSASKLNILMEDLDDSIVALQAELAQIRANLLRDGKSVAASKLLVESEPRNSELNALKAKKARILEHIRISKERAKSHYYNI